MPAASTAFEGYSPLDPEYLSGSRSVIPPKTSITGKLYLVYEKVDMSEGRVPRISIVVNAAIPVSGVLADYVIPSSSRGATRQIQLDILPGPSMAEKGLKECRAALSTALAKLKKGSAKQIQVSLEGGHYKGAQIIPGEDGKKVPVIECAGNRLIQFDGSNAIMLVLERPPASIEPPWLSTPAPPPSLPPMTPKTMIPVKTSKPIPPPRHAPSTQLSTQLGGVSTGSATSSKRFQPINAHRLSLGALSADLSQQTVTTGKRRLSVGSRTESSTMSKKQKLEQGHVRKTSESGMSRRGSDASTASGQAEPVGQANARAGEEGSEKSLARMTSRNSSPSSAREAGPSTVKPPSRATAPASPRHRLSQSPAPTPVDHHPAPIQPTSPVQLERQNSPSPPPPVQQIAEIARAPPAFQPSAKPPSPQPPSPAPPPPQHLSKSPTPPAPVLPPAMSTNPPLPAISALEERRQAQKEAEAVARRKVALEEAARNPQPVANVLHAEDRFIDSSAAPTPSVVQIQPQGQAGSSSAMYHRGAAGPSGDFASRNPAGAAPVPQAAQQQVLYTPISGMAGIVSGRHERVANMVGVVWGQNNAVPAGGGQYINRTYIMTDPTVVGDDSTATHFSVTISRLRTEDLPELPRGTSVLFKNLKIKEWAGKVKGQGFVGDALTWAFLHCNQVVYAKSTDPLLTEYENGKLSDMKDWWATKTSGESEVASEPVEKPLTLLKDVIPGKGFPKLAFKIIHVVDNRRSLDSASRYRPQLEVYFTDGTLYNGETWKRHDHGADIPDSAVARLAIFEPPTDTEMQRWYQVGIYLSMPNVRSESYCGALQLALSEKVTAAQAAMGWKDRRPTVLYPDDSRVVAIEQRLQTLRSGHPVSGRAASHQTSHSSSVPAAAPTHQPPARIPPVAAAQPQSGPSAPDIPQSNRLCTTFSDPTLHRLTPLAEVFTNQTVPNRFKVRARVAQIYTVGKKSGAYVTKYCTKESCRRSFNLEKNNKSAQSAYCQSCNDLTLKHGELRYRFLMLLTTSPTITLPTASDPPAPYDPKSYLPVLISDADAEKILPYLQPLGSSINAHPGKETTLQGRLLKDKDEIETILLGNWMNKERQHPTADWCIESYIARAPQGKGAEPGEGVVMYRMFGMEEKSIDVRVSELAKGLI